MEVHHHSHTARKKWTNYLWEFLMLFLAVFCGFLAENIREHQIEKKREAQYIGAMIEDLKEDTASFAAVISVNEEACKKIDTLIFLLKGPDPNASANEIYIKARTIPVMDMNLSCQNKTFEQLKSSGGLRLIHNVTTQNKIGAYYQIDKYIETGPTLMQYQNRRDLFLSFDQLFDAGKMQQVMKAYSTHSMNFGHNDFALLTTDPKIINTFCTRYHIIYSTKKIVANQAKGFIKQAIALMAYLIKEYHLE